MSIFANIGKPSGKSLFKISCIFIIININFSLTFSYISNIKK